MLLERNQGQDLMGGTRPKGGGQPFILDADGSDKPVVGGQVKGAARHLPPCHVANGQAPLGGRVSGGMQRVKRGAGRSP